MVWRSQKFADLPEALAVEVASGQIVWTPVVERLVEAADFGPDSTSQDQRMVVELAANAR
jgi:hypothetical protein